jgi:hypothetical protein
MSHKSGLKSWENTVIEHMPHLSKSQAVVLALWSFGIVIAQTCGLTSVAACIALILGQRENTLRQRLREWYWACEEKKGEKRVTLEVTASFTPLVTWVLSWWESTENRVALAMDATTLGDVFTVLVISIVYRGCAIPVAWVIVSATTKGSWKPLWLNLLDQMKGSIPDEWFVIVMADRGLYARWLYKRIVKSGWHPFLRINKGGTYRCQATTSFRPLSLAAPTIGSSWCGHVTCFKSHPLACTLLACWTEGHTDAWVIVTDLLPEQANVFWYGMRMWIECEFKLTKRSGWKWHRTRMSDPERASRLWLAIAVATLWVVSVGGEAEDNLPASSFEELPDTHIARRNASMSSKASQPRVLSCFRRGILVILTTLIAGEPLPLGYFFPKPWSPSLADMSSSINVSPGSPEIKEIKSRE